MKQEPRCRHFLSARPKPSLRRLNIYQVCCQGQTVLTPPSCPPRIAGGRGARREGVTDAATVSFLFHLNLFSASIHVSAEEEKNKINQQKKTWFSFCPRSSSWWRSLCRRDADRRSCLSIYYWSSALCLSMKRGGRWAPAERPHTFQTGGRNCSSSSRWREFSWLPV